MLYSKNPRKRVLFYALMKYVAFSASHCIVCIQAHGGAQVWYNNGREGDGDE